MESDHIKLPYPSVKRDDKIVTFAHGGQITDGYQWLENINSEEVKDFVYSQNEVTVTYLEKCKELGKIKEDLRAMSARRNMSCPSEHVATRSWYFFMNAEGGNADSLYVQRGMEGKPEVLLSPNNLPNSSPEKSYCLRMFNVSRDGEIIAYAFSVKGSKWWSIKFKEVLTGTDLSDLLTNVCLSDISWTADGKGILYSCYNDKKAINHQIVFHRIGTEQLDDLVLVEFPDRPAMTLQAQISDCGEMVFVYGRLNDSLQHMHFFYGDFNFTVEEDYQSTPLLFHLLGGNALDIQYITNVENKVYFRTNHCAPNFRIVSINLCTYDRSASHSWKTVIEQDPQKFLDWAVCVKTNFLMVCYLHHSTHQLELHKLEDGTLLYRYSLPIGTIKEYFGTSQCPRFYFVFTSFVTPDCVRYIEITEGCCVKMNPWGRKKIRTFNKDLNKQFNTSGYVVKQLFCFHPTDNALIPVFVAHKKGIKMNETSPCMIYAQGCFGIQTMPSFSISKWAFLKYFGGIVAVVGVRGGGEYGAKWYEHGCGIHKGNTYQDFVAATEYLIKLGYTSPSKLILEGESYGGNLAAVCMTRKPELYSAVIIHDGLLDMLRFHLFPESRKYLTEFGNPDVEEDFDFLQSTSPVHNIFIKTDKFPAVLTILGNGRSFSHPSNSYKFVARTQSYLALQPNCINPCLLLSNSGSQSSGGASELLDDVLLKIEERADIFAFLIQSLGLTLKMDQLKK